MPEEKEATMVIVTSWMEEGIEIGEKKGRFEGRFEGQIEMGLRIVTSLLKKRIGIVTPEAEARLSTLSAEQLEILAVDLYGMESQEELANWFSTLSELENLNTNL